MKTVSIDHSVKEVLEVNIDGAPYNIPLLSELTLKEVKELQKIAKQGDDAAFEWECKYIERYLPKKVYENLRSGDIRKIFIVLSGASSDGANLGE